MKNITHEEIKDVLKEVRRIQIRTGKVVSDVLAGEYHSVFKGRGMEFDKVREYVHGDDVRGIDWNVTARMNQPHVKSFKEERELTMMLLVDVSSSSGFGTTGYSKANIIAKICATLAFSAIKNNDKAALILFSDVIEKYIPPQKGSKHVLRIIRELLISAKMLESSKSKVKTDISAALEYLNRSHKKRGICFIISDFVSTDFKKDLQIAAKRHDIIAISVTDPKELEIPDVGIIEMVDSETGEVMLVNTSDSEFRKEFEQIGKTESNKRKILLNSMGVDLLEINTGKPFENLLVTFFKAKGKKR